MQYPRPLALSNSCTKSEAYFRALRWKGKRYCPSCGYKRKIYILSDGRFNCPRCSLRFREFSGTYLDHLRIPFNELSHILYLFVLGVPSYRCRGYLSVSLKTAQRIYTMFRHAIYDHSLVQLQEMILSGEIEMDETLYGGHRKGKRGWGAAGKHMVFGMYQRNGHVMTFPVPDRKIDTLILLVFQHSKTGSLYYSDDWHAPIRGIEGFWSFSKNWLYQYRGIPTHHFHLYLKETEFRFNNRERDLFQLISHLLTNNLVPSMS